MRRPLLDGGPSQTVHVDFDPEDILRRDPYLLLDARLLAPLLARYAEELGPDRARIAVTQIGALLGLRDAQRAAARADHQRRPGAAPVPTPLRLRCHQRLAADGSLEIRGEWPDRVEAGARLAAAGTQPAGGCQLSLGYTTGWLTGLSEQELYAAEEACGVDGHPSCRFVARSADAWRAQAGPDRVEGFAALELAALREFVRQQRDPLVPPELDAGDGAGHVDRDACAIHLWGPVMVIPYGGPDEALSALELIGRDPTARDVSVVVLDLEGAIVDEAHGALALEHIVHSIQAWGAEAIFTEPSPLSMPVVNELANAPLLVVKDLDQAIATAFQVAACQRYEL